MNLFYRLRFIVYADSIYLPHKMGICKGQIQWQVVLHKETHDQQSLVNITFHSFSCILFISKTCPGVCMSIYLCNHSPFVLPHYPHITLRNTGHFI